METQKQVKLLEVNCSNRTSTYTYTYERYFWKLTVRTNLRKIENIRVPTLTPVLRFEHSNATYTHTQWKKRIPQLWIHIFIFVYQKQKEIKHNQANFSREKKIIVNGIKTWSYRLVSTLKQMLQIV